MPQVWSLVLESFTTVGVSKLVEARIVDTLIRAFLRASAEIQQSTFPQILAISETITKDKSHSKDAGKLLSNLVFTTLASATGNPGLEAVGYSVCQGWLDIMISSSVSRTPSIEGPSEAVHIRMDAAEVSSFLRKTAKFLRTHLNLGSFEGPTGAKKSVVMRLNLACDLLLVAMNVRLKEADSLALGDLESVVAQDKQLRQEYHASLDDLVSWLFLNARGAAEEQAPSGLGNVALQTPATAKVKRITDLLESYLLRLGAGGSQEAACQVALSSLVRVVKQLNRSLSRAAEEGTIGADALLSLGRRTNEYFTQFVGNWLKSDAIASHFVFELGGFEFLLDTIGKRDEGKAPSETSPRAKEGQEGRPTIHAALPPGRAEGEPASSDIYELLYAGEEGHEEDQKTPSAPAGGEGAKTASGGPEHEQELPLDEPPQLVLGELANKQLVLTEDNTGGNVASTHSKVDWSCNKRAYKNRLMVTGLQGALRNEYWVLFKLQQTALLKEIQVGFTNYWSTDAEAYSEPLTVLVQAGLERNSLTTVCSLELAKDDGFGSVQATVFGKNLHSFQVAGGEVAQTVEGLIQSKLASLQNFQANYIKLSMRRHVLCCLENSPLAAR
jgi:hypothetical protein